MSNKNFEVEFQTGAYDTAIGFLPQIDNIVPKSISLSCYNCKIYSKLNIDNMVPRFSLPMRFGKLKTKDINEFHFDFICSCINCHNTIFIKALVYIKVLGDMVDEEQSGGKIIEVYPDKVNIVIAPEIPEKYANDFREAQLVLDLSPKASAALSRRILQNVLREEFKIQENSLAKEIEIFITLSNIPSYLTDAVDAIRNIGNFAAHPLKDTNTGEIVDVEVGEAEWLIEVLNFLLDFQFIQRKKLQQRKNQLNAKLSALGKPKMK